MSKLTEVQNELKAPKNLYNQFGKFKYRSCEDILEAVKPLCKKHGCELLLSDEIVIVGDRYYVKATCTFYDGEHTTTTTAYAREELEKKGMDAAQVTGATSSYARKYALNAMFLIDDNKDSDVSQVNEAPKTAKPVQKSQQTVNAILSKEQIDDIKYEADICQDIEQLKQVYKVHFSKGEWNDELKDYFANIKRTKGWS